MEPTNGEIVIKLEGLGEKFDLFAERNTDDHNELKEHAVRTNGRLTRLERWKDMILGGGIIVNVIMVPIFLFVIFRYLESK